MRRLLRWSLCLLVYVASAMLASQVHAQSDKTTIEDGWVHTRDEQTGVLLLTKELVLHPAAEPRPALKYHLLPDDFESQPGNAAVYYLKATGFLEQDHARKRLREIWSEAADKARREGGDVAKLPPHVWLDTAPKDLPVDEVKEYVRLSSFQLPMLREAARRRIYDMDRNFREMDDPIAHPLPELQGLRELARTQSIRCRLAIAENRVDDAIEIIGQQLALARHLGQDDFLVSNLNGIAVLGIAWNDALYLLQHPDAPNLYWAWTAMPDPLVDIKHAMAIERQFLYQQIKVLREVGETPRPPGYWQDFVDRAVSQIGMLASELNLPSVERDPELARAAVIAYVAAAYPGAKEYLINEWNMPSEQVEAYPTAQVVFLAMVRFYDQWRDDIFKWMHLPIWQFRAKATVNSIDKLMADKADRYGWIAAPTQVLLPAVLAAQTAVARSEQQVALLQTVEAVRLYAAANNGKLPASLNVLPVPAPIEPFTGKPIDYELLGDRAVLNGYSLPGMRYRLILRMASE